MRLMDLEIYCYSIMYSGSTTAITEGNGNVTEVKDCCGQAFL